MSFSLTASRLSRSYTGHEIPARGDHAHDGNMSDSGRKAMAIAHHRLHSMPATLLRIRMMKNILSCSLIVILLANLRAMAAPTDDVYHLGPDSQPQEGVPQGKAVGPTALASNVYPDTSRNYWVYVPAQYDAAKPASLMIFFDGHA